MFSVRTSNTVVDLYRNKMKYQVTWSKMYGVAMLPGKFDHMTLIFLYKLINYSVACSDTAMWVWWNLFEPRHAKTGLNNFLCHIKRRPGWHKPSQTSFGMLQTIELITTISLEQILSVTPKEGLAGLVPTKLSFGMTTTEIWRTVFAWSCSYYLLMKSDNYEISILRTWGKHLMPFIVLY